MSVGDVCHSGIVSTHGCSSTSTKWARPEKGDLTTECPGPGLALRKGTGQQSSIQGASPRKPAHKQMYLDKPAQRTLVRGTSLRDLLSSRSGDSRWPRPGARTGHRTATHEEPPYRCCYIACRFAFPCHTMAPLVTQLEKSPAYRGISKTPQKI